MNKKWKISDIVNWTGARIISENQTDFSELGTDTRKDLSGKIFIALVGEQFDAHNYIEQAVAQGAGCLIVHRWDEKWEKFKNQVTILQVDDTLKALQQFARGYRQSLSAKVIGITGSNGKTTTKEFTATLLKRYKNTHYNQGSFNNHWGVPLTLLETPPDASFVVVEMGMNHAGEIAQLVQIADPDVVVCTMVGRAHIEFFGTQKKIAEAKSEIYMESKESTVRIFNQDQDLTFDMMYPVSKKFPAGRMLSFSEKNKHADVYFEVEKITTEGLLVAGSIAGLAGAAKIPVFGQHNITNLMAAACVAYAVGMPVEKIWESLKYCKSVWGRNEFIQTQKQVDILFDGYNANPDSMLALIESIKLVQSRGRKIAVFAQMKELGSQAADLHYELGKKVGEQNYDFVYFIGENYNDFQKGLISTGYDRYLVDGDLTEKIKSEFLSQLSQGDFVFIKGSRGAKTERFVELCQPLDWSAYVSK